MNGRMLIFYNMKHQAVAEAAVVGVPDEKRGEIVKAFIVLRPDLSHAINWLQK